MSRKLFSFLVLVFFALNPALEAMVRPVNGEVHITSETVGVRTIKYQDVKRNRPVVVELWYPTDRTGPFDEPSDRIWVHPKEIRNAPFSNSAKKCPLIMMSHGYRGDRRDRSWLADRLARCGFIVASVDHHGNTRGTFDLLSSLKFWERGRDISFAIDQLSLEPGLADRVNLSKIGFVGYSLGGMTGLGLAGATVRPVEAILSAVTKRQKDIKPEFLSHVDMSQASISLKDERIGAMLLICPASFVYEPESLGNIKIPVGLVAAINDEVLPFSEHASLIIENLSVAKLKMMKKGITHYSFLNRVSEEGKKLIQKDYYSDPSSSDRISVHQEVGAFSVDFFREYL